MLFGDSSVASYIVSKQVSETPLAKRRLKKIVLSICLSFPDKFSNVKAGRFHFLVKFKVPPYSLGFPDAQILTAVRTPVYGALSVPLGGDQLKQTASYIEFLLKCGSTWKFFIHLRIIPAVPR